MIGSFIQEPTPTIPQFKRGTWIINLPENTQIQQGNCTYNYTNSHGMWTAFFDWTWAWIGDTIAGGGTQDERDGELTDMALKHDLAVCIYLHVLLLCIVYTITYINMISIITYVRKHIVYIKQLPKQQSVFGYGMDQKVKWIVHLKQMIHIVHQIIVIILMYIIILFIKNKKLEFLENY